MFCCAAIAQFYCSSQQCLDCGVGTSILHWERERERELHGLTACKFQSEEGGYDYNSSSLFKLFVAPYC
jgi:hypothetical protein